MTLKEMKNKIYALLDIEGEENVFTRSIDTVIDSAAKKVAVYTKSIKKSITLTFLLENGKSVAALPHDFAAFCYVRSGRVYYERENFEIISGKLRSEVVGAGNFELVYVAFPPEVNTETDEDTDMGFDDYVCDTVCYGAAMELCTNVYPSDVQKYMRLATEYDERLANLLTAANDGTRVANGFFASARGVFI